uniref:Uncharacterized protein n=1 Tax=Tetraselmis sp. GSL018 TaxID=582737 RepID=A0A061S365_9CHLO
MFASTMQFFRMFMEPLRLRRSVLNSDLLEAAVMRPWDNRLLLGELLFKLLRDNPETPFTDRDCDRWEPMLEKKMAKRWDMHFDSNPLGERSFFGITPNQRIHILYALCEWYWIARP